MISSHVFRHQRIRWGSFVLILSVWLGVGAAADEPDPNNLDSLVGASIHIQLSDGSLIRAAKVKSVRLGKITDTLASVTITDPKSGKPRPISAMTIQQLKKTDGTCHLKFDESSKRLVSPDPDTLARVHQAIEAEKAVRDARLAARERAKQALEEKKRLEEQDARQKSLAEELARRKRESDRLAHFQKTGIWLWPELTANQLATATTEQKAFLAKVEQVFPMNNMRLYETEFFLFYSDMPPDQVALYTPYLDTMYHKLCKAFGIAEGTNIWRGKAVVVAFLNELSFLQFEQVFYSITPKGVHGLAHQRGDGNVVIGCYRGNEPTGFSRMLVHETAHGFMHRYKSRERIPSWLNEGAADWIAAVVVPLDETIAQRRKSSIEMMRKTHSLGGTFFSADHIQDWQYGAASSVTDFLIQNGPSQYSQMMQSIKTGVSWQDALKKSYNLTPEQLAFQYGIAVGVRGLRP